MAVAQREIEVRPEVLDRLADARTNTDELFALVKPEALYDRPIPERHRIVFYIGHLEAFDWNLLSGRVLSLSAFQPDLDRLFAFGIDPVGGGLPTDRTEDWPNITAVREYVARTRHALDEALESRFSNGQWGDTDFSPNVLLEVALEHRLMHAETLAYMLHQLPFDRKVLPGMRPEPVITAVTPEMVRVPEGFATLGLQRDGGMFGWDNEFEEHRVHEPAFWIDRYKVTNGQFLEFLAAGGYEKQELWSERDWNWRVARNVEHPGFWLRRGGDWYLRGMFDEALLPLAWPVYVSHAEASAYARWAGKSLPTESQWHRAAFGTPGREERMLPWGTESPDSRHGNFNFQRWDPTPVGAFPEGESAFGAMDIFGNGWEWTSTLFAPFPGFEPFPFYLGYSADFFDQKHFVMKGGSARTAACMMRRSFRNWFQPHYPYVYAGFRCVSH
jgi:gamma-glutamyl hercynylcysteine S-oxide synthase